MLKMAKSLVRDGERVTSFRYAEDHLERLRLADLKAALPVPNWRLGECGGRKQQKGREGKESASHKRGRESDAGSTGRTPTAYGLRRRTRVCSGRLVPDFNDVRTPSQGRHHQLELVALWETAFRDTPTTS